MNNIFSWLNGLIAAATAPLVQLSHYLTGEDEDSGRMLTLEVYDFTNGIDKGAADVAVVVGAARGCLIYVNTVESSATLEIHDKAAASSFSDATLIRRISTAAIGEFYIKHTFVNGIALNFSGTTARVAVGWVPVV